MLLIPLTGHTSQGLVARVLGPLKGSEAFTPSETGVRLPVISVWNGWVVEEYSTEITVI